MTLRFFLIGLGLQVVLGCAPEKAHEFEVVVYGDTPAAFVAAMSARKAGTEALLVSPTEKRNAIRSISRLVEAHSADVLDGSVWTDLRSRDLKMVETEDTHADQDLDVWIQAFEDSIKEVELNAYWGFQLVSVASRESKIQSLLVEDSTGSILVPGKVFIDATSVGALKTMAGVTQGTLSSEWAADEVQYKIMIPDYEECTNLLVLMSAFETDLGNRTIDEDRTALRSGERAGILAARAAQNNSAVQDVSIEHAK